MPITASQVQKAARQQLEAAHDERDQIRLVAGPGTGKSHAVQERVAWLLSTGIPGDRIFVTSYTRASTRDLKQRTLAYCQGKRLVGTEQVRITTLHSLALRALRLARQLYFHVDPCVMDRWELENVLDEEFRVHTGLAKGRCKEIREAYEAFCQTGTWLPPNYPPPDPPVSDAERASYEQFSSCRTAVYSCVLPGQIVRLCNENTEAGILNPVRLLNIEHLIVDEYQDLNPVDLQFIDHLIAEGAVAFVAGDDDQSIYSFRYASPQGIQSFLDRYPEAGNHILTHCFRCTPNILSAAQPLMVRFAVPQRIPKELVSLYEESDPPIPGVVHRWKFSSDSDEARAVARSCAALIGGGLGSDEIMILYSNGRLQSRCLEAALQEAGLPHSSHGDFFARTDGGKCVQALVRIACDPDDYLAHRLVLGLQPKVGTHTCNTIAELVASNGLNYGAIFGSPLPAAVFSGRLLRALQGARAVCAAVSQWTPDDTLSIRGDDIAAIISTSFGGAMLEAWQAQRSELPDGMTLAELREYLWVEREEERVLLLARVRERLGLPEQDCAVTPRIRLMTMHGAKGLSASVVFIPGLEDSILPGVLRGPYPGQVREAARLLYCSITRAKAACILSYAERRYAYDRVKAHAPSRFVPSVGGPFQPCAGGGLQPQEVEYILASCGSL